DVTIKRDFVEARNTRRCRVNQRSGEPRAKDDAKESTGQRKEDIFSEQLANQASAASAQRHAYSNFTIAFCGARELQIGNIHARDQQDEAYGSHQYEKRRPDVFHDCVQKRLHRDGIFAVGLRMKLVETLRDVPHLRLRLLNGDAWFQSRICVDAWMIAAIG